MTSNTKILNQLKRAANYTKLAEHQDGPRSYNRGQGALLKVLAKFGKKDSLAKKKLEKTLEWKGCEVGKVAKKAQKNGYVTISDEKGKFIVTLTAKGREIVEKRFEAEDRVADAILAYLSDKEKKQLQKITGKIIDACEDMGVDYSIIERDKFHHDMRTRGGNGKGWCGPEMHPGFVHSHPHEHDGVWHEHSHLHEGDADDHHHEHFGGPAPADAPHCDAHDAGSCEVQPADGEPVAPEEAPNPSDGE